jgi:hypothetical protein
VKYTSGTDILAELEQERSDAAALRERIRLLEQDLEEALHLLRWWADRSMKTGSLTASSVESQMDRRLATEIFLYTDQEESNPAPSGWGKASPDTSPGGQET